MDILILAIVCILGFYTRQECYGLGIETPQKRLVRELLDAYGVPSLRPVRNISAPVKVQLRLLIAQVIKFDERAQLLKLSAWMKQTWTDEYLQWNVSDYGGVDLVPLSLSTIWTPDITLYENVNGVFEQYKPIDALVSPEGRVTWYAPVILTTSCKVKVRYFPFDRQHCQLRFASWVYDKAKLDILYLNDSDAMQMVFHSNGVWNLHQVKSNRTELKYECCPDPIAFVTFNLVLKRESGFYIVNIVIPCIMLALLTLLVFCLPHESGEKISFGTTNLLALILYQQLIADSMPPSGDEFPLVGMYFFSLVVIGCLSIFGTVCVLHLWHKKADAPFPPILRRLLDSKFAKYCMALHGKDQGDLNNQAFPVLNVKQTLDTDSNFSNVFSISGMIQLLENAHENGTNLKEIEEWLKQYHITAATNVQNVKGHNDKPDTLTEWKHTAILLDKLSFTVLCFSTIVILISMIILFSLQVHEDM